MISVVKQLATNNGILSKPNCKAGKTLDKFLVQEVVDYYLLYIWRNNPRNGKEKPKGTKTKKINSLQFKRNLLITLSGIYNRTP